MSDKPAPTGAAAACKDYLFRAVLPGLEVRDSEDGGSPKLSGHFAVFNQWTEINSLFEGRFMEQFAPGAFKRTIDHNGDQIKVLFQHGRDPVVGDKPLGTIDALREDDIGAYYEVSMLDTSYNRDLIPGLRAGLYGASFRFQVVEEKRNDHPARSAYNPDGLPERTVTQARLAEFGPVSFPAYPTATAGVRSVTDRFLALDSLALAQLDEDTQRKLLSALARGLGEDHSAHATREHDTDGLGPDHSAVIKLGLWLSDNMIPMEGRT